MERSLSVLLPVRDAQRTLAASVLELLDVLPELTEHFELVIVDDGSKDATIEVADELATHYPQIRVMRHGQSRGRAAAIETGLRCSRGDVIFLSDEGCRLSIDEVGRLWRAMEEHDLALGCPQTIREPKWNRWSGPDAGGQSGFQMARRQAIEPIKEALTDQVALRARLERLGSRWYEVELPDRRSRRGPSSSVVTSAIGRTRVRPQVPPAGDTRSPTGPKAPNYLARLKEFALGE